ncbi:hypothetical protein [Bacillus pseudomycoides]|uniref:hypothetical protein n=1 Tax=Bacillus pseudomycoides TaxID=64104 RepID=UPI0001A145E4|nr:hypothetical protein [Bacillus pseudomycoides]EEM02477.1 hypothetical protein bmyco0002_51660 [Bacillus pseudomycoides]PEP84159.1 hypothetical protein CN584_15185 [Bacillus pseudomycoides]PGC39806.1 hypothetical protein COM18_16990 [Bacillus pseudomycoides]
MENPAYKLHNLLEKAYKECEAYDSTPKFRSTWAKVFEINPDDTSALLTSVNSLLSLFLTTQEYIKNNDKLNNDRNLKFLKRIEQSLSSLNIDGTMSTFKSYMNSETLTALSFISEHMSFVYDFHESVINAEEIGNLVSEIDKLVENITLSDLPEDIKSLLFKNLHTIRSSLISYKISGIDGMKTALEQTIGSLFMNNEVITPVAQDDNVKGIFNIIDKVNSILSTGVAAKDLIGPIFSLLLK